MTAEVERGGVGEEVGRPTKEAPETSSGGVTGPTGGVAGLTDISLPFVVIFVSSYLYYLHPRTFLPKLSLL